MPGTEVIFHIIRTGGGGRGRQTGTLGGRGDAHQVPNSSETSCHPLSSTWCQARCQVLGTHRGCDRVLGLRELVVWGPCRETPREGRPGSRQVFRGRGGSAVLHQHTQRCWAQKDDCPVFVDGRMGALTLKVCRDPGSQLDCSHHPPKKRLPRCGLFLRLQKALGGGRGERHLAPRCAPGCPKF